MWDRTKLFGVAFLLPAMLDIVVFDVIFLDKYGALASATIYTLLLFVIVLCNKDAVMRAIRELFVQRSERFSIRVAAMALGLMAVLFAFDQLLVNLFGHGRG